MPYSELKQLVHALYGPGLALRAIFPREQRQVIGRGLHLTLGLLFVLTVLTFALDASPVLSGFPGTAFLAGLSGRVYGLFLLVLSAAFVLSALEAFHRSYYFRGLAQILSEQIDPEHPPVGWGVATIVATTHDSDITGGFLESGFGQEILFRAGVTVELFEEFMRSRQPVLVAGAFVIDRDRGITLSTYTKSLTKQDETFRHFLATASISAEQLVQAAGWVTEIERTDRKTERWWSRDNLGRVPGIGKTWGYGEVYLLERYGHDLTEDHIWPSAMMTRHAEDDEVEDLEQVLARARQSNALLVGEDLTTARQRVAQLYQKIREGHVLPPLEGKRVFIVDMESIVAASTGTKAGFEEELRSLMDQAVHAGNTIIFFEHLATTIASTASIGVDLIDVLQPYFESPEIQIVATCDGQSFHEHLSRDGRVTQAFDVVKMRSFDQSGMLNVLEQRALNRERVTGITFTIPSLDAIILGADRYFPTGIMPDKAFDLLEELIPFAQARHLKQITRPHVDELIRSKTGIPIGEPTQEERTKLMSLEDFMHKRVVGQERAVSAVAKALRRARAGVGSANKPMGSFLFLGPTGVGKTETSKALAEALFGDEEAMIRFDMSEFQGDDALEELLGSFTTGKSGRLATAIRDRQYGVLLLDEFEKSNRDVHDLFLQVLDEGVFTDAAGKPVNARNLIIIATSNAGAELIWQWEKEGKDLTKQKAALVDHIVNAGLYRPEFLNRFDDIVLFHPLKEDHIRKIARIQLDVVRKRLYNDRNITLEVTDDLVVALAKIGYDPRFGGRPMQRAIKEQVEQAVADKILAGALKAGDTLALTEHDLPAPQEEETA